MKIALLFLKKGKCLLHKIHFGNGYSFPIYFDVTQITFFGMSAQLRLIRMIYILINMKKEILV